MDDEQVAVIKQRCWPIPSKPKHRHCPTAIMSPQRLGTVDGPSEAYFDSSNWWNINRGALTLTLWTPRLWQRSIWSWSFYFNSFNRLNIIGGTTSSVGLQTWRGVLNISSLRILTEIHLKLDLDSFNQWDINRGKESEDFDSSPAEDLTLTLWTPRLWQRSIWSFDLHINSPPEAWI